MSEDHLDKTTSLSVDLSSTGAKAKAKSRFVAAVDRLCGNLVDFVNMPVERHTSKGRAIIDGERKLIDAAVKYGINQMKGDPDFANRVIENQLGSLFRKQANKDAVVAAALEDLRNNPITPEEDEAGNPEPDGMFLNRLELYSDEASDQQLRQKWGSVLAAETRKPGTFSVKALRIVDELEPSTALLFEKVCESRLANVLPKCLVGELSFGDAKALIEAELIVDPGIGQIRRCVKKDDAPGGPIWMLYLDEFAVAIPLNSKLSLPEHFDPKAELSALKKGENDAPCMPIYVLTTVGHAVSQILLSHRRHAFELLVEKIRVIAPAAFQLVVGPDDEYTPVTD